MSVRFRSYGSGMQRLRTLSEAECYARCYGERIGIKVTHAERRRPRFALDVSGEDLRELFEEKLDAREPAVVEEAA
jgi:hypothetical protein